MLICPTCDFENPDHNRFCQQCGNALQLWRALLLPRPHLSDLLNSSVASSPSAPTSSNEEADESSEVSAAALIRYLKDAAFLDESKRYRLVSSQATQLSAKAASTQVLDCLPSQSSPIATVQHQWLQDPDLDPEMADLPQTLPAESLPYLALQANFFPAIPEIHHAWETPYYAVLLIEDRELWPRFEDKWAAERVSDLQRVHWLYEMAVLWEALVPWQAHGQLLNLHHLCLDADDLLCLEVLPINHDTTSNAAFEDFVQVLERLLGLIQPQLSPKLADLATCLQQQQINDSEALQSKLVELVRSLQEMRDIEDATSPDLRVYSQEADDPELSADRLSPLANSLDDASDILGMTPPASLSDDDFQALNERLGADSGDDGFDLPTTVLPMKLVHLDEIGRTHVGRQREHNEDCFYAQTQLQRLDTPQGPTVEAKGFYILCDGMGGHASGEVASNLAVKTLREYFTHHWRQALPEQPELEKSVFAANQAIYDLNQQGDRAGSSRMGTTLVMLLLQDTQGAIVHVGDSRLYTYTRRQGLMQITVDHEVGQREIQRGVEPAIAYARPDAYQLTQALGPRSQEDLRPSISYLDIQEDTLFILCSDGLSDNDLLEQHCDTHVKPLLRSKASLEEGAEDLMDLANEHNGHDNITVVLVRLKLRPNMDKLVNG